MNGRSTRSRRSRQVGSESQALVASALRPSGWSERWERNGRSVRYTTVGARPRGREWSPEPRLAHLVSSVMVVTDHPAVDLKDDVALWVTLARRVLQRGTLPVVPSEAPEAWPEPTPAVVEALFADRAWNLDPAVALDSRYEQPFFADVRARYPAEAVFVIPQARLEDLVGESDADTRQWVDFCVVAPNGAPTVLEIDGAQHARAAGVDRSRDAALRAGGIRSVRVASVAGRLDSAPLFAVIREGEVGGKPPVASALKGALDAVRMVYSIVELVAVGCLVPADRWDLAVDVAEVDQRVVKASLDVVAALDALWGTGVVPAVIRARGGLSIDWANPFASIGDRAATSSASLRVEWGPVWGDVASCPAGGVLIRGVPLPVHPGWDPPLVVERRRLSADSVARADVEAALATVSSYVLGIPTFRPGQFRAISRVLTGSDALVLLPTGSGKSLIYQVALMVMPGTTLVIDPIKALIDDQERRFLDEGIDRVAAIHSGRVVDAAERDVLNRSVASGHALVALVSPERLQVAAFRDSLLEAATEGLVNLAVVDEAHCVSEWGHDFRTSYLRLARSVRRFGRDRGDVPPPLLALTGTASPAVLRDVVNELGLDDGDPEMVQRPAENDRVNLTYEVLVGADERSFAMIDAAITQLIPAALGCTLGDMVQLDGDATACGVVFVPWASSTGKFGVAKVQEGVIEAVVRSGLGTPAVSGYTGEMSDDDRVRVAADFRRNRTSVLVATKAFGMGIDKPNIRWTVHVGIPSSIEAFVQEAGRAGRDGAPAHCMVVSGGPSAKAIGPHLNTSVGPMERRKRYRTERWQLGDVGRQLFFLYNSFPGSILDEDDSALASVLRASWRTDEQSQAAAVFEHVRAVGGGPLASVVVRRVPFQVEEHVRADRSLSDNDRKRVLDGCRQLVDKALHRLSIIGVVDDLTVDYGADSVTIELAHYSAESIDAATLAYANQTLPGRYRDHAAVIAAAPVDLDERVKHHLGFVVSLIYQVIEPARLNALAEMWRLTSNAPTDATIRGTIAAYLGGGPTSVLLAELVQRPSIDVDDCLMRLSATARGDEFDWAGSSARLLEAYPGHPILLFVRAGGEAFLPNGTLHGFTQQAVDLASSFGTYSIEAPGQATIFLRLIDILRNARRGGRADWVPALWSAWLEVLGDCDALDNVASATLLDPGSASAGELDAALAYRLRVATACAVVPDSMRGLAQHE